MPKILITGQPEPADIIDNYIEAANNCGLDPIFVDIRNLTISFDSNAVELHNGSEKLTDFEYVIGVAEKYEKTHSTIAYLFPNKHVLNGKHLSQTPNFSDKRIQQMHLVRNDLLTPKNFYSYNALMVRELANYPLIGKSLDDQKSFSGAGVAKLNSDQDLEEYTIKAGSSNYLVQSFLNQPEPAIDYRSIFIGDKHIGSVKRVANYGWKTNSSKTQEIFEPDEQILEDMTKFMRAEELDLAAFDYGIDQEGKYSIYEINRFPYFGIFNQVHHKNLANDVIGYITGK